MKKNSCPDCGNNPAPHALLFCAQTLVFVGGVLARKPRKHTKKRLHHFAQHVVGILGISRWKSDITKLGSERSEVVVDAAKKRGIVLEQEYLFGSPTDTFRYTSAGVVREFFSLPTSPDDDASTRKRLDNKWTTKKILLSLKTQTPPAALIWRRRQLDAAIHSVGFPMIIKPAQGSRGRHTTISIHNKADLLTAYKSAKKLCFFVVAERHIDGMVYRFTTVGGKLAAVLRGDYPMVIGDGKTPLSELIARKDTHRPDGVHPAKVDTRLISRQGFDMNSIPKKGTQILLGSKIGVRYGGDAVEITPTVHQSFRDEVERVAGNLELLVLGFDIIAQDPSKPANTQDWGIIEINTIPFIDLHHHPRAGKPVDVADLIWQKLGL